jgi:hypothetical protein
VHYRTPEDGNKPLKPRTTITITPLSLHPLDYTRQQVFAFGMIPVLHLNIADATYGYVPTESTCALLVALFGSLARELVSPNPIVDLIKDLQ